VSSHCMEVVDSGYIGIQNLIKACLECLEQVQAGMFERPGQTGFELPYKMTERKDRRLNKLNFLHSKVGPYFLTKALSVSFRETERNGKRVSFRFRFHFFRFVSFPFPNFGNGCLTFRFRFVSVSIKKRNGTETKRNGETVFAYCRYI